MGLIGAVVLAAGQSRRMGQPKLILRWGSRVVIEQVVATLIEAGVYEVVVVTGGGRALVEAALEGYPVRFVENPLFEQTEMLTSLQTGIQAISPEVDGLLVALGDQPALEVSSVRAVIDTFLKEEAGLVVSSYALRRGHPWLVVRSYWPELLGLTADQTLRDFLNAHTSEIRYVPVESRGVLTDIDTPGDYAAQKPR